MQTAPQITNPLQQLNEYGQSVWLDYIRRDLITGGELKRMVEQDGLGGVTSNPAIFEKAIAGSNVYSDLLEQMRGQSALAIYEAIAIRDIQDAADVLRPVYDRTNRADGFVSLEVSPYLAFETQATIEEARRLWKAVARPNLMIKVPGTEQGAPAIEQLISEGINVNVTLLFSKAAYERVAQAFIDGLDRWVASGGDAGGVASVASFFVSRIDAVIDGVLEKKIAASSDPAEQARLQALLGKAAIANAKIAYQSYKRLFSGTRWAALAAKGAHAQRVLWASTGTKNPNYRDVLYVEELIGPDTVNTMPPATLDAFRDHGLLRASLEENVADAEAQLAALAPAGISLDAVTSDLVQKGVKLFADAFDQLLGAVGKRQ